MKRVLSIFLCVLLALLGQAATVEKADSAVINMGLGWNLGNTLEANHQIAQSPSYNDYWGGQGLDSETCWGQTASNPEIFSMLRKAGFGAVRIPITWYNHMDKEGNIQPEWMERVHAIIDEALAAGLYVIINVHHDTGADTPAGHISWVKADMTWYNNYKSLFETLWLKIANEFRDYDEHLLFEGYNEMLDNLIRTQKKSYPIRVLLFMVQLSTWSKLSYAKEMEMTLRIPIVIPLEANVFTTYSGSLFRSPHVAYI